jgi:hypothetical protein
MERTSPSFHRRFNIPVAQAEAEGNFVNRILNFVSLEYPALQDASFPAVLDERRKHRLVAIASSLGEQFATQTIFEQYVNHDFYRCLLALESLYHTLSEPEATKFTQHLESIISQSEVDLGIRWTNGNFLPTGAKVLDEALVNENLQWLSVPQYKNVLAPFQKGLSEFLKGQRDPNKLRDVVRDMYEALEAMAKVTTGRPNKDLSENRELFVNKLRLSHHFAIMLRDYIEYACEFRHGVDASSTRTPPLVQEVEAFIYTTGLFLRLALQTTT